MGRVLVTARIENVEDVYAARDGKIPPESVRAIEVTDAPVDTGANGVCMPRTLLAQLGLRFVATRRTKTAGGTVDARIFGTAILTIDGRSGPTDIVELPDECPILIGQIPLEALDFIVNMKQHRLIANPEHGGEHMIEVW